MRSDHSNIAQLYSAKWLRDILINSCQVNLVNSALSTSLKFLEDKGTHHFENIAQLDPTFLIFY